MFIRLCVRKGVVDQWSAVEPPEVAFLLNVVKSNPKVTTKASRRNSNKIAGCIVICCDVTKPKMVKHSDCSSRVTENSGPRSWEHLGSLILFSFTLILVAAQFSLTLSQFALVPVPLHRVCKHQK